MVVKERSYDLAVVGSDMLGIAHAFEAAIRGLSVIVIDENEYSLSHQSKTSQENQLIWPIGQPSHLLDRVMHTRERFIKLAYTIGFPIHKTGSLHLAYQEDELNVLEEFMATTSRQAYQCKMLTPEETIEHSQVVRPIGLEGAMYSMTECSLNFAEARKEITAYLQKELSVQFIYGATIEHISDSYIYGNLHQWKAERIIVCSEKSSKNLFPQLFQERRKEVIHQTTLSIPQTSNFELGPNIAAGLAILNSPSFAHCVSLRALQQRVEKEYKSYFTAGLHSFFTQVKKGECLIICREQQAEGDSSLAPEESRTLILKHLKKSLQIPNWEISTVSEQVYTKLAMEQSEGIFQAAENVWVVGGLEVQETTFSFGLAKEILDGKLTTI